MEANIMSEVNEKFNTIMPETTDRVLCVQIDRLISEVGYKENFLPRLEKMIEKYGEIRLLVNYLNFEGWENDAAREDMFSSVSLGRKVKKMALVNTPESEIFRRTMIEENISGETKLFSEEQLQDAIEWVKS